MSSISTVTMDSIVRFLIVFSLTTLDLANSLIYNVKVGTDSYINVIDPRFLSFTVDPKYLFSKNFMYNGKESVCMAESLAPAYLRIAGPSTSQMTFHNSSITFTDLTNIHFDNDHFNEVLKKTKETLGIKLRNKNVESEEDSGNNKENFGVIKRFNGNNFGSDEQPSTAKNVKRKSRHSKREKDKSVKKDGKDLAVSESQWLQFAIWAKANGFDLVFALNNEEKMASGLWDPNSALNILTLAAKENVSNLHWQLGYECRNQSIDEYLNDLETLRAIVDSFEARDWESVGGDVTKCLRQDSKSDFRDFVTLSDDMMDAVVLNGNSSAHEIQRMSDHDRLQLLRVLSNSSTPLWLVDTPVAHHSEFDRAADWMTSLGYSAKNGFAVNFRELVEDELFEPTLSFYMALMYKHLVGSKVLNVELEAAEAALFAHCTSLHQKPVPGSVTFFGTNMADEVARFAIKMSKREEGGDVMQFILGVEKDYITMNGRPIHETDIRPVIRRVRPYKTLLLSLPPNSFGFWVLSNTRIDSCLPVEDFDNNPVFVEAASIDDDYLQPSNKTKRSMIADNDVLIETLVREGLRERLSEINNSLRNVRQALNDKGSVELLKRKRREIGDSNVIQYSKRKVRNLVKKYRNSDEPKPRLNFLRKMFGLTLRPEGAKLSHKERVRKAISTEKKSVHKRKNNEKKVDSIQESQENVEVPNAKALTRNRRSVLLHEKAPAQKKSEELSVENEIDDLDVDALKQAKLWKILHKIHNQIKDLSIEDDGSNKESDHKGETTESKEQHHRRHKHVNSESKEEDHIVVKTKMLDDGATINFREKTKNGLLKSTINNVVSVLSDLNNNLNKFWSAITLLD